MFLIWGERERAEDLWRQVQELADRTQEPVLVLLALGIEMQRGVLSGDLLTVVDMRQRVVVRDAELGATAFGQLQAHSGSMRALLLLGRATEALAGVPTTRAEERALCLAHGGRLPEAQSLLRQLVSQWQISFTEDETDIQVLTALLETAVMAQDGEIAEVLTARLAHSGSFASVLWNSVCIGRILGEGSVFLQRPEDARRYYQAALEVATKLRHRPEIALTHLDLAELDAAEGHTQEAQARLAACIPELEAMGMAPALERAEALREALGG
ncbi:MAG: tetratricopeptide repeat protein [Chloroflexi bacterium]|nr:tetratricopeptide repeat protein [Chloroflexota bacterium]